MHLDDFGCVWSRLAASGRVCLRLVVSRCVWMRLTAFGRAWLRFVEFGRV